MGSPEAALGTLRPDLEASFQEYELEADYGGYVATKVAPVVEVAKQAGTYGIIPIAQLLQNRDTERAPGSGYSRGKFTFNKATFATVEHGAEDVVDDREAKMYADYFDAEQIAAMRARNALLVNAEKRMAAAIFNATTWTSQTTGVTNEWDDATNAVPLTDVETAVQAVYGQCGMWPNALIITREVYRNLRNVDQIINRIKFAGITDPRAGAISLQAMSQVFDLPFIIVAGGTKNSAIEGATASPAAIWDDEYAMIAKIATSQDMKEPCIARTFHWSDDGSSIGGTVDSYREEAIRGEVVRVRHDVDEVVLYVKAGHLLSNITS